MIEINEDRSVTYHMTVVFHREGWVDRGVRHGPPDLRTASDGEESREILDVYIEGSDLTDAQLEAIRPVLQELVDKEKLK